MDYVIARSGDRSARLNGKLLNSAYDPRREAARFVERALAESTELSLVILLGDTLPYVRAEIRKRAPKAAVISVYYDPAFVDPEDGVDTVVLTSIDDEAQLRAFFEASIDERAAAGIRVIEWPASAEARPESSTIANRVILQFLRELRGNVATTRGFAERWLRNALINFLTLPPPVALPPTDKPVLVAAAGPTLTDDLATIRDLREELCIVALSSALETLRSAGVLPDVVVATDPGYWSRLHVRAPGAAKLNFVMPITASPGAWTDGARVTLLDGDSIGERGLYRALSSPPAAMLSGGTAASTAFDVSLYISSGPIFLAGMDMAYRDILEHARPHGFDPYIEQHADRIHPIEETYVTRAAGATVRVDANTRVTPALRAYAGWMERRFRSITERPIYRLAPTSVLLRGTVPIEASAMRDTLHARRKPAPNGAAYGRAVDAPALPARADRQRIVFDLLSRWESSLREERARAGRAADSWSTTRASREMWELLSALAPGELSELERAGEKHTARDRTGPLFDAAVESVGRLRKRYLG